MFEDLHRPHLGRREASARARAWGDAIRLAALTSAMFFINTVLPPRRLQAPHPSEELPRPHHETRDVSLQALFLGGVATLVILTGIVLVIGAVFPVRRLDVAVRTPLPAPTPPVLQSSPSRDFKAFYDAEMKRLHSFGWVDKAHGIAHIPIEQAMQQVAQHGIEGWPSQ
jgi:hypothetical protein